nr:ribonuclease H-like domain-containing protein [Tanacetum cinerariifolium]
MVIRFCVGTNRPTERLNLHVSSVSPLPKSYRDAFSDPNWQNAMRDEYNALIKNNTWTLVPRQPDTNIVRCMWLFCHKYLEDGTLSRYKARLVANGSTQIEGDDVDETFSPVVKPGTIQTVLSLAASRHWSIHQLDVKNAFLHGDLSETVYMHQPSDDIVLTASFEGLLQRIIGSLHQEFAMTDLGPLNYFLGISVTHDSSESCRFSPVSYFTRPDIPYAVQQVCLYMHDPREPHLCALKRILRYVQGTLNYGLHLISSSTIDLVAYSDADWAGCPTTRRLTSGYCVFLGNNLLSWSSKRQQTLSRSSAQAEYRGVANDVAETCVMSSPNHPTSDIEDAFSSNFPDYIPASPNYVSSSPGKTYSSSSNKSSGLVPIASPTLSLFYDDPYMKVMHAYYAKESPIPPPVIKRGRDRSSSSTSVLPEEFEIGESSHKKSLERHEEQTEEILNHLDELSFNNIENIEDNIEGL